MPWYNLVERKDYIIFAVEKTGRSAVRLAHLLWEQGVASSNLATPTQNFGDNPRSPAASPPPETDFFVREVWLRVKGAHQYPHTSNIFPSNNHRRIHQIPKYRRDAACRVRRQTIIPHPAHIDTRAPEMAHLRRPPRVRQDADLPVTGYARAPRRRARRDPTSCRAFVRTPI